MPAEEPERRIPVWSFGSRSLAFSREGRIEAWLLEEPERLESLRKGEDILLGQNYGENESASTSVLLSPLVGDAGLEGLVCLDIPAAGKPAGQELATLRNLYVDLVRAVLEVEAVRKTNAELERRVSDLREDASKLTRQRDLLESQSEVRVHSFSTAIHDLRTPLVAIRGYARLLLEQERGPVSGPQQEYLTVILENANHIIGSLSGLARSFASQPLRLESFDFRELWRESVAFLRSQASTKSIEFAVELPAEPARITGDREKLSFVLHKLLSNAVKFNSRGAQIEVEVLAGPEHVAARIRDTGEGIPPELVEKAFGFRPHAGDVEAGSGVSLVHDIIRMHGGRIAVTSGLGEGWTLSLTLPVV